MDIPPIAIILIVASIIFMIRMIKKNQHQQGKPWLILRKKYEGPFTTSELIEQILESSTYGRLKIKNNDKSGNWVTLNEVMEIYPELSRFSEEINKVKMERSALGLDKVEDETSSVQAGSTEGLPPFRGVRNGQELIGLWVKDEADISNATIAIWCIDQGGSDQVKLQATLGQYRVVPNNANNDGGYFCMFNNEIAPGET